MPTSNFGYFCYNYYGLKKRRLPYFRFVFLCLSLFFALQDTCDNRCIDPLVETRNMHILRVVRFVRTWYIYMREGNFRNVTKI